MAARHNLGFSTYRESIYALLGEDFRLHDGQLDTSEDDIEKNKKTALTTATINHSNYCEKVAEAPLLDDSSYDSIRKKRNKTEEERLAEKKTAIAHRYATENVTSDLVDKDSDFDWYRTIQLHYLLTVGSEFLLHRDHVRVSQLAKNTGKVFSPDANRACLAATIKALEAVNIGQFLVLDKTWTKYDLEAWHNDLISKRNDIKTFTGVAIGANKDDKNNGPIRCAKRLLAKLGLDLVPVDCRRINGEPTKVYRLATLNPDGRIAIFERWAEMDRSVQENVV
jgi:hypothetical protein